MPRPPSRPRLRPALLGWAALVLGGGLVSRCIFLAGTRLALSPGAATPAAPPLPAFRPETAGFPAGLPPVSPLPSSTDGSPNAPSAPSSLAEIMALSERGDHAHAAALACALPEDQRAAALSSLFALWAAENRTEAAAAALALSEASDRGFAWRAVLVQWAPADPAGLAAHALSLPDDTPRRQALAEAMHHWLVRDADAALAWAGALPSTAEHDGVVAQVAQDPALIREKTDLALAWAETLHDSALRSRVLGRVVREWREFEPAAAERFARQSPDLSPSEREDILVGERFTAHP